MRVSRRATRAIEMSWIQRLRTPLNRSPGQFNQRLWPLSNRRPKGPENRGRLTSRPPPYLINGLKRAAKRQKKSQANDIDDPPSVLDRRRPYQRNSKWRILNEPYTPDSAPSSLTMPLPINQRRLARKAENEAALKMEAAEKAAEKRERQKRIAREIRVVELLEKTWRNFRRNEHRNDMATRE